MLGIVKADGRKIPLADESVQCVVTSPPYWGLRKYAGEQELVWAPLSPEGEAVRFEHCEHEWSSNGRRPPHPDRSTGGHDGNGSGIFVDHIERGSQAAKQSRGEAVAFGNTCFHCGAWRGAYGLEPSADCGSAASKQMVLRKDLTADEREFVIRELQQLDLL